MIKPSKRVASFMIIIFAFTCAFIVSDKIKNRDSSENEPEEVEGEIQKDTSVKSIGEYMVSKLEERASEARADSIDQEESTLTDFAFTRLLSSYENLKLNSQNSPENISILRKTVAQQTIETAKLPTKYDIIDLKTFPDYDKIKSHEYGNKFAEIAEKYFKQQFLIKDTGDSMKFVEDYSLIQANFADELSKIEVPRSISDEHLDYINNLAKIAIALVKVSEDTQDPILHGLIINEYNEIRSQQPQILISISDYFINNGIIFYDNEPGAMWNSI